MSAKDKHNYTVFQKKTSTANVCWMFLQRMALCTFELNNAILLARCTLVAKQNDVIIMKFLTYVENEISNKTCTVSGSFLQINDIGQFCNLFTTWSLCTKMSLLVTAFMPPSLTAHLENHLMANCITNTVQQL